MSQLREIYGVYNAETMLKSLAARIVFAAKDVSAAQEISNELGFTTVKVKTLSRPLMGFDSRGSPFAQCQHQRATPRAVLAAGSEGIGE